MPFHYLFIYLILWLSLKAKTNFKIDYIIYLHHLVWQKYISKELRRIKYTKLVHTSRLWLRKVDDTFAITNHDIEMTLQELNETTATTKVKFTAEVGQDNQISFLDCPIKLLRMK